MRYMYSNNYYINVTSILVRFYIAELPSYSAGANVSIVATNLSSDTEYVFTCYATSVVGDGEHSDQITVRTGEFPIS